MVHKVITFAIFVAVVWLVADRLEVPILPVVPRVPSVLVDALDAACPNNETAELYGWIFLEVGELLKADDGQVLVTGSDYYWLARITGRRAKEAGGGEDNPELPKVIKGEFEKCGKDPGKLSDERRKLVIETFDLIGNGLIASAKR